MSNSSSRQAFAQVDQRFTELSARSDLQTATVAGGCFWCMEAPFEAQAGVEEVIAGYTGGQREFPTYKQVLSEATGHREAVQIYFDPTKINYQEILDIYWLQIDPTDPGGQFADRGYHYTTAIYYHTQDQQQVAEQSKQTLDNSGRFEEPVVTAILPAQTFYPAEDYHQNYYKEQSSQYERYQSLSGRKAFVEKVKQRVFGE